MRKITLLLLFISSYWSYSQVKNYTFTRASETYTAFTDGQALGSTTSDEQYFVDTTVAGGTAKTGVGIDIGFPFTYNGYSYDKFAIHVNGWIALGTTTAGVNATVSNTSDPLISTTAITPEPLSARIAAFALNLQGQAGAGIQYKTTGTSPNRQLIVQWTKYKRNGAATSVDNFNFQIRLTETTNTVEFIYGTCTSSGTGWTDYTNIFDIGLRAEPSATVSNFSNLSSATSLNSAVVGVSSSETVTITAAAGAPTSGSVIRWTPPTCSYAKDFTISGITDTGVTVTGTTINWGSYSPDPLGYQYIVSTSATLPLATDSGANLTDPATALSGLTPFTNYNLYVRSACSTDFSQWKKAVVFKTKCSDKTAFTENFDSYTSGSSAPMPDCWAKSVTGTALVYISSGSGSPGTAPNQLYMTANGSTPTVAYAILPTVSNLNTGTYRLKFKAYATTASRTFDVGYFTDVVNQTGFVSIGLPITLPYTPSLQYTSAQEFTIYPPTTIPDGVKNLVFRNAGTGSVLGSTSLNIDDVIWQPIPPCTDVKNIAVKLPTSTSVNLSWDVTGTETAWQYAVSASTVTDPSTIPAASILDVTQNAVNVNGATRSVTVNNLTANTSNKIWVRSNCGNGAYGLWFTSPVFSTPCTSATTLVEDFDLTTSLPNCWRKIGADGTVSVVASIGKGTSNGLQLITGTTTGACTDPANYGKVFAFIPPLSTSMIPGYRLRFTYKVPSGSTNTMDIVCIKDPINFTGATTDYTILKSLTAIPAGNEIEFNEALPLATTPYIAIRFAHCTSNSKLYVDNFVWEQLPACTSDVSAITLNAITDTSVKLGWTSDTSISQWQYALGTPTTVNPGNLDASDFVTTSPIGTIAALTPSTSYKIWIRSKCTDGTLGSWIGPFYFTTNCPAVATFTQNFNSSLNFPSCWNKVITTLSSPPTVGILTQGSTNVLQIQGKPSSGDTYKGIVAIQPVSNYAAGTQILRFKLSGSKVGSVLEIGYLTNPSDQSTFISSNRTYTVSSTTVYSDQVADLGFEPVSQVLAFRSNGISTDSSYNSVYIDDVVWEAKPTCPDISNRAITAVTSTTVDLSWAKGTSEDSWQYALTSTTETDPNKLTAVDFPNPTTINDPNISSTLTGLTPATKYTIWIRPKCATGLYGVWGSPLVFLTTCTPTDSVTEKFDVSTTMPACWAEVGTQGNASVVAITGASTPNALKITSTGTVKTVVALPAANHTKDGTYRLRFKFRCFNATTSNVQVGYVTNISDPTSFNVVASFTAAASDVFYSKTVLMDNKPTSEVLAFKNQGGYDIYIDDVYWEPIPSCLEVSAVKTVKSASTAIDLGWKKGGSETAWQYAFGLSTDTDPSGAPTDFVTPVITGSDIVGRIENLTPSTSYKVWLRSKCGDTSFSLWSEPFYFTTNCLAVETFTQNFDASSNLPSCWTKVGNQGTVQVQSGTGAPSGSNTLFISSNAVNNMPVIAMQPVSNASSGTNRLRFKFKGSIVGAVIEVGYLKVATDATSFVSLTSFTATTTTAYEKKIVYLGIQPGSEVLAFRTSAVVITGVTYASSFNIDDVIWEPIPPCLEISGLAAQKIVSDNAQFAWTPVGPETAWQYALGASTDLNPTVIQDFVAPATVNSVVFGTINNLTPVTNYKLWARAKCSDTSFGEWSDPISFTTPCDPVSSFTQNFDASVSMPSCWGKVGTTGTVTVGAGVGASIPNGLTMNSTAATAPAIVAMPPVNNAAAATNRLRFKVRASVANSTLEVGYLEDVANPASFKMTQTISIISTDAYDSNSVQFGTTPISQVLAFRNPGAVSSTIFIDDVVWEPVPSCADIKDLTLSSISTNSATFKWTADPSHIGWQYAKGGATDTDATALTAVDVDVTAPTAITFNDLIPSTSYTVWVRSKCDFGVLGTWIGPLTITTPCLAATEFTENFDTTAVNSVPTCWRKVGVAGAAFVKSTTGAPSGQQVLYMNSPNTESLAVVAMPTLANLGDATHMLKFKFSGNYAKTGLELGYLTDILDPASFVSIQTFTTTVANIFQSQTAAIPSLPTEAKVLAFRRPGYSNLIVLIDDVSWELLPATPACATAVTATPDANCGNYATAISWPAVATATGYILNIGTTSGGSDVLNNQDLGNKLTYSASGNANTTYYYTVKPYNIGGTTIGCEEKTFTTNANACYCVSVPTSKDGNGVTNVLLGASNFAVPIAPDTYINFTDKQVNLAQGANTNLKISFNTGLFSDNVYVWIDFNDNTTFEPTEMVYSGVSAHAASTILDASFIMDGHAPKGFHRMRISTVANATDPNPCYGGAQGMTLDFNVNIVSPPANDDLLQAFALTVGNTFADDAITGTNVDATGSVQEAAPGCGNYNGSDVWYTAVVPASGNITFEVNSLAGGITNTAAAVYTNYMVLIACDDASSTAGKLLNDNQPKITLTGRTPGERLYLRIWENGGDAYGDYLVSAYDTTPTLATDKFDIGNFKYYPNPVKDVLNIAFDQEISDVVVTNLLGQQVISKSVNANQVKLDMSDLSVGTYLVKVTSGNQSKTIKAVKE